MHQLLGNCKLVKLADGAAAGTSAITGTSVDLQGWEGVLFFTAIPVADAGNFLKVQDSADNSSFNDVAGSAAVAASNNDAVAVDVSRPLLRYAQPVLVRAGASTASLVIWALLYGGKNAPQSEDAHHVTKTLVGPADGTP